VSTEVFCFFALERGSVKNRCAHSDDDARVRGDAGQYGSARTCSPFSAEADALQATHRQCLFMAVSSICKGVVPCAKKGCDF